MSREISIFTDYRKDENSLTNYCGLLMKLLYENSPRQFEELLATIVKTNIIVGPTFTQQTKATKSIPDLAISQKSFSIFFETKTSNWFYDEQIIRHLESFNPSAEDKILFLLSNFEQSDLEEHFKNAIEEAKKYKVTLQPLTFEDFVGSLEQVCNSEYLKNLLDEFKIYLDSKGRLPRWKYLLDVVNCSETLNEVEQGVYMCPDTGGTYNHRRAKYFGTYANKEVANIFEIKAIVVIDKNLGEGKIKWNNSSDKDALLIEEARTQLQKWDWRIEENRTFPLQVFLLDNRAETKFIKETSGGMWQSRKYFWDIASDCKNSKELAAKLLNKNWGDVKTGEMYK